MSSTPRLEEVIDHAIDHRLSNFYTALPAEITWVDPASNLVGIQILACNAIEGQDGKKFWILPKVDGVPLLLPWGHSKSGKKFGMTFPIAPGDQVMYVVATLSIAQYYSKGSAMLDEDPVLLNNLRSGFVVPGSHYAGSPPLPISDDALVLHGEKVKIGGPTGTEPTIKGTTFKTDLNNLLDLISAFATSINNAATSDGGLAKATLTTAIGVFKAAWNTRLTSNTEVK